MPIIELYDTNHTGLNADIMFSAYTGGSYSLGIQTIPYSFDSEYPYGYYDLTYTQWGQVCSVFVLPPILFPKVNTTYGLTPILLINGYSTFDMTIDWGDGQISAYTSSNSYNPQHTYSTPNTEYNISIEFSDNSLVAYLQINSVNFTSLENINVLTNLYSLLATGNKLTSLDVSNMSTLYYLNCNGNLINNINLQGCTSLNSLVVANNQLTNLNVNTLNSLFYLECSNNLISSLNLSNNTLLNQLYCDGNQLTSLNLLNNNSLSQLSFPYNQISTLNLTGFDYLTYFISNNNLLSVNTVNDILVGLAGNAQNSGQVNLQSQNPAACPTGTGITAISTLLSKSWSVSYDVACPPYFEIVVDTTTNNYAGFYIQSNVTSQYGIDWGDGSSIQYGYDSFIYQNYYYGTPGFYSIKIYWNFSQITYMDLTNYGGFNITDVNGLNLMTSLNNLYASYNLIPTTNINDILIELSGTSVTGGSANLEGQTPPACPTGDGILAQNHLVNDLGWTVVVDTGCP